MTRAPNEMESAFVRRTSSTTNGLGVYGWSALAAWAGALRSAASAKPAPNPDMVLVRISDAS